MAMRVKAMAAAVLAAALAAELALGRDLPMAVAGAKAYVHEAIRTSYWVGEKCGVLGFAEDTEHVEKATSAQA